MKKWLFISISLFFLQLHWSAGAQESELLVHKDLRLIPLEDSLYIHRSWHEMEPYGRFSSNGLLLIKQGKALLVDTPMNQELTRLLYTYVSDSLGAQIELFIPGHFHDDSSGGLAFLHEQGVHSLANRMTTEQLRKLNEERPRSSFNGSHQLNFYGEDIELFYPGPGHSVDNIVIYLPGNKLLFGGCLVRSLQSNSLGNTADAELKEWGPTLRSVSRKYPQLRQVVPGHGSKGGPELISHSIKLWEEQLN